MAERTKLTYSARLKFARYISLLVITTTVKPKQTSNVVNAYSVTNCLLPFFWRETRRFVLPWVCHLTLRRPRHCLHSRDASRLNCLHGAIPIALVASDFPFRLLVDAVTHVLSVFRVCKVP